MSNSILLLTPPFTQLNTPYPATAYIKGFLNTLNQAAVQADLGINVMLRIFSRQGLNDMFDLAEQKGIARYSANSQRIFRLKKAYLNTIDPIIRFLQYGDPTLAYNICDEEYLPQASRFEQLEEMDWAFGTMGIQDKARHLATLYLEDIGDFIQEVLDPHFGFSRYAEKLGRSAVSFDPLHDALQLPLSFTDRYLIEELELLMQKHQPSLVCLSVPFPGNLYGALRCGQYIKEKYPNSKVAMGGGYPNTELRSMNEPRLFEYLDFVTLDDGEAPLSCLIEYLEDKRPLEQLKRTFVLHEGQVKYINQARISDIAFSKTGTPDYTGLSLQRYLSVIEIANPMHRLWSDGRWNKLTMAHGCYWKKCSFCDITLDYIKNYEPISAALICDRIEELMAQTGESGFHFVDEAAPPALMREVALEILKRDLKITWWTNIRFEERFTYDLCRLLKASGCIAVSGGLEVASDRLLDLMQKGVSVSQVAKVAHNFTESGIMVHAYLMYGFPTQTTQETVDSLEMVRQLFMMNVLQSGFWHMFAMTAHAPIGISPSAFKVVKTGPEKGNFAENDLDFEDPVGTDHGSFSAGLKKALFNYMHGIGFEFPLQDWFDFRIPRTTVPPNFIYKAITNNEGRMPKPDQKVVWLGMQPYLVQQVTHKKGKQQEQNYLVVEKHTESVRVKVPRPLGEWLCTIAQLAEPQRNEKELQFKTLQSSYEEHGLGPFEPFLHSPVFAQVREIGLLLV